ncbi:MAG: NADP-dependent oxidoreductase [Lactobacillaceae bacterium]|jgi:NADPH:quinone reductase-like Zn-dependent oxidoreductase|nr:NADP-dependent oxidoreductase [Lactobacillaceae bacterium]
MNAIEMINYGDAKDVLRASVVSEPEITEKQVLIEVFATAVEPYDVKYRKGLFGTDGKLPVVLGSSLAGIVKEVGPEAEGDLKVGDRVVASPHFKGYAEYAAVLGKQVAKLPDDVSFESATAFALSGQAAYQIVNDELHVTSGDLLLVDGANGAVGLSAIQIAKALGAHVIALVRDANLENESAKYADEVVSNLDDVEFDKAFDVIGGDVLADIVVNANPSAKVVSINNETEYNNVENTYMKSNGESLEKVVNLVAGDRIEVPIAHVYELTQDDLIQAHLDYEQKKYQLGKLVIKVK